MPKVGLLIDTAGVEQFVGQTFRDHLGVDHTPADQLMTFAPFLQTAFYSVYPTSLLTGSPRMFKSGGYPRTFKSGGYKRTFKA